MNVIYNPSRDTWASLCLRPEFGKTYLENAVRDILYKVKTEKDEALKYFALKYDGFCPESFLVPEKEIESAASLVSSDLKKAIKKAAENIEKFHSTQSDPGPVIETSKGIKCWRKNVPVEKVGLYIPGGSAPLFSTLLMLGIPAKIAGCGLIEVCTPAGKDGKVNPLILYTASVIGLKNIYRTGGAQAIAALAYGTETIQKVYKIFGPGNQYVTKAKQLVQQEGVAIDMPAGPSEVLVVADNSAEASFIASDLISQAEHGPDSQVIMATDSKELISRVQSEVERQTVLLPRKEIIMKALENSKLILFNDTEESIDFSNEYAPEHLVLNIEDAKIMSEKVTNAGSVFIGPYSCESMGDYASGTNHTLPTNGYAKNYSGVSLNSFLKTITFQEVSREGISELGPVVEQMAEAESLLGHKNAVTLRLKQ